MKNFIKAVSIAMLSLMLFVGCAKLEPGFAVVVVPNFGGYREVTVADVQVGAVTWSPWDSGYQYPIRQQRFDYSTDTNKGQSGDTAIQFNAIDGTSVTANVAFSARVVDLNAIPKLWKRFGRIDFEEIVYGQLQDRMEEAFKRAVNEGKYRPLEILGARLLEFQDKVEDKFTTDMKQFDIVVTDLTIIGKPIVPPEVTAAITAAATANQNVITKTAEQKTLTAVAGGEANRERLKAETEAAIKVSQAKADAEAIRLRNSSLTDKSLELEKLRIKSEEVKVQGELVKKWDGKLPQTVTGNSSIISLPSVAK